MIKCPFLRDGKISKRGFPVLAPIFSQYFQNDIPDAHEDSVDIFGAATAADILEFLGRPSQMCRWCSANYSTFNGVFQPRGWKNGSLPKKSQQPTAAEGRA
jgi:hypothetical protein